MITTDRLRTIHKTIKATDMPEDKSVEGMYGALAARLPDLTMDEFIEACQEFLHSGFPREDEHSATMPSIQYVNLNGMDIGTQIHTVIVTGGGVPTDENIDRIQRDFEGWKKETSQPNANILDFLREQLSAHVN
jgi:hypothetical protein